MRLRADRGRSGHLRYYAGLSGDRLWLSSEERRSALDGANLSAIARFVEKADRDIAQAYLDAGDYLWNSGIFVMKASVWLCGFYPFAVRTFLAACRKTLGAVSQDGDFVRVDRAARAVSL